MRTLAGHRTIIVGTAVLSGVPTAYAAPSPRGAPGRTMPSAASAQAGANPPGAAQPIRTIAAASPPPVVRAALVVMGGPVRPTWIATDRGIYDRTASPSACCPSPARARPPTRYGPTRAISWGCLPQRSLVQASGALTSY
jgi:hypothetical protein